MAIFERDWPTLAVDSAESKERRGALTKQTLATTLTILFIFPVISLAGHVEVGDIKVRWEKAFGAGCAFWAKIPVINYANYEYRVIGKLLFYDRDGVEFYGIPFWVAVEANPLSLSASGKKRFRMEKALPFPPWYNY